MNIYFYGCKHRTMTRGHKCDYKKQINEEMLDDAVICTVTKLVSNPKFASMMKDKINMNIDTSVIDNEIGTLEKQLRLFYSQKAQILEDLDMLSPDDKHYHRRKIDLDDRLYKMYDKIEDIESGLTECKAKKATLESEKIQGDNIYKVLVYFDRLFAVMNDEERRRFLVALVSEVNIYEEAQPNGQWLKSIVFNLPIIDEDISISLDNGQQIESVCLLSKENTRDGATR